MNHRNNYNLSVTLSQSGGVWIPVHLKDFWLQHKADKMSHLDLKLGNFAQNIFIKSLHLPYLKPEAVLSHIQYALFHSTGCTNVHTTIIMITDAVSEIIIEN